MVISSVIFISAFTVIQLNSKLDDLTRYNSFHANLSIRIVKNNLDSIIAQHDPQDLQSELSFSLIKLKETGLFSDAIIFDKNGVVVGTTNDAGGPSVRYKDIVKWGEFGKSFSENKWFITEIDKFTRTLEAYLLIKNQTQQYLCKLSFSLGDIQEAFTAIFRSVIFSAIIIILANIILGYIISKIVIGPVKMLDQVTKIIAEGDLSVRVNIRTNDELEDLGETFNYMAQKLVKMKEIAENANPLTKLPGNIVIQDKAEDYINTNRKFALIYSDLDNFKAYNDKYGIAQGDKAIKLTSDIFKEAVQKLGNADDFVGHEGGDDFIILTTPDKANIIAEYIIKEFDARIKSLFNAEDLAKGHIVSHARDGSIKEFPIMTISLAGVTNQHRQINSYAEATNIAAEVKKKAKSIDTSVFIMDKRTS